MAEKSNSYVQLDHSKPSSPRHSTLRGLGRLTLSIFYLLRASLTGGPGTEFHLAIALRALRLVSLGLSLPQAYRLIAAPMDSFRYFEFDFFWKSVRSRQTLGNYLDISSPRLFSWRVLASGKSKRAILCNPDLKDLGQTRELLRATALIDHCELQSALISELVEQPQSFDTVVCISVLEHIPHDSAALQTIWNLIKPGGRLLLSVPCARESFEEHTDFNEYGLLQVEKNGMVFGQRFYDQKLLDEHIHSIVGYPIRSAIYGEKTAGFFMHDRQSKLSNPNYPYWKEAWLMASQYSYVNSLEDLPGVGVVAFEFVKS